MPQPLNRQSHAPGQGSGGGSSVNAQAITQRAASTWVPRAPGATGSPIVSNVVVTTTSDGAQVTWDVSPASYGRLEHGLTTSYGTLTLAQVAPLSSHLQTITGYSPGQVVHFRIWTDAANSIPGIDRTFAVPGSGGGGFGVPAWAQALRDASTGRTYIDVPWPFTQAQCDITGATDVTTTVNNWVASLASGPSSSVHRRPQFPVNGILMMSRGICSGTKNNTTLKGNGCRIKVNPAYTGAHQYSSAFNVGYGYGGSPSANLTGGAVNSYVIDGFKGTGTNPNPGNWVVSGNSGENQSFVEAQNATGLEILGCTDVRGFGGDFIRTHADDVYVHDNIQVDAGRQFISAIQGARFLSERNAMGQVAYFFYDVEPNAGSENMVDFIAQDDTGGTHSHGIIGGLLASASGSPGTYGTIARVWILRTHIDGALNVYVGQSSGNRMTDLRIMDNIGQGSASSASCSIVTTGQNGGLMQIKVTDGVIITGNKCNGTGPFACVMTSTAVNVTNNTTLAGVARSPSTMYTPLLYGPGFAMDSKGNRVIGGPNLAALSNRFVASTSSPLNYVIWQIRRAAGYSLGTGGTVRIELKADDGTANHRPTGAALATVNVGGKADNGGADGGYVIKSTFASPYTVTAGTIYHLVFTNVDASPASNYVSQNFAFLQHTEANSVGTRQPAFTDLFAVMSTDPDGSTTGSTFDLVAGHFSDIDIAYADGTHDGNAYLQGSSINSGQYALVSGASIKARERIVVATGDKTVSAAYVRVGRQSGSGSLVIALKNAAGTILGSVTVPNASVPAITLNTGDDNGDWVGGAFGANVTLVNGSTYYLELSCAAGTQFSWVPMLSRDGGDNGTDYIHSRAFTEGSAQETTDGTNYAAVISGGFPQNFQMYMVTT